MKPPTHHLTGVRLEREIERCARDFLAVVRDTRATGREPSTVRVAKVGLVPAWNAWLAVLDAWSGERRDQLRLSARGDQGMSAVLDAAVDRFVEALRVRNPSVHAKLTKEDARKPAMLAASAALCQVRPHVVIEPTAALQTGLVQTDIGNDVPVSLFQLRPTGTGDICACRPMARSVRCASCFSSRPRWCAQTGCTRTKPITTDTSSS